ncbi:30S ribosomal protein S1 [Planctomycetota bacterium]
MVDRNIINKLGLKNEELEEQVEKMFGSKESELLEGIMQEKVDSCLPGTIIKGRIVTRLGNDVIVEVGLKSEGVVDVSEFDDPEEIEQGREIEVLLEDNDSSGGLILLSKHKADRIKGWEKIINTKKEGDVVTGKVIRRIKGGLLVDVGVPVFLPASQVDIRKPGDISRFIGKEVKCKILKIDIEGHNIVISRRKLIEEERRESKEKVLSEIEVGHLRKGVVKNIADFGVFVDLGGVDGLLHISDLSWGRISHPTEVVELDQEIEVVVIGFDKENEKISLGLKQKTPSPWEDVEQRYPIGARINGKVVNIMNYGVFIRLEDGIEGLVHISEMSWTKRLNHPSEMLSLGEEVEIVVLNVNKNKQEISLGLKQTETNPWALAQQKYPPGTIVTATVRNTTNFGAFVEIEPGLDGMIHISDLSWTKKYGHPSEALKKGEQVKCLVLDVDVEKQHISLGIKQMTEDPWIKAIPEKYIAGHIIKGKVTKLTNFGAFVELEPNLEGLLHISELADHKVDKAQDVVEEGDEIEIKILKVDPDARKIGLSLRRAKWAVEDEASETAQKPKKPSTPIGVQTVLSDSDKFAQSKQTQEKQQETTEKGDSDKAAESETEAKVDESEQESKEAEQTGLEENTSDTKIDEEKIEDGDKDKIEAPGEAEESKVGQNVSDTKEDAPPPQPESEDKEKARLVQEKPEQSQTELTEQDTAGDTKIDFDVTEKKTDTEAES